MSVTDTQRVARAPERPLLVYDGDCGFCRFWIARWRERTGRRVAYRRSQQVAGRFPEISREEFQSAVQLIEPDGGVQSGADAVFRAFDFAKRKPVWLEATRSLPGFMGLARGAYRFVARHRAFFSFLTRLLWGRSFRRPSFFIARWLFLRLLGAVYLVAFLSLLVQMRGLFGTRGILPAAQYLEAVRAQTGAERYWLLPTICWWNASDEFLRTICVAGAIFSLAVIFDCWAGGALIFLWALYLSLTAIGRTFLGFQWDALLLEAGLLAIFLVTPRRLRPDWRAHDFSTKIARALLLWLAFRLTLESGLCKIVSGDSTWHNLTALCYHYETQPLPLRTSWYLHQAPLAWQKFSTFVMFAIELAAPFTMLAPARVRRLGCASMIALQALIAVSGNYCFFNCLTSSLYLLLLDDEIWPARWRRLAKPAAEPVRGWSPWLIAPLAATSAMVTTMQLFAQMRVRLPWPEPCVALYRAVAPLQSFNDYGLFAVMTTARAEIIIEGSDDGVSWLAYEFKWKPGDVTRAPRLAAPYQPRLDWQMWFAALGTMRDNPWFVSFLHRLLEGSPDVLALLAHTPFPGAPPRYLRAQIYDYKFTRRGDGSSAWWHRELTGTYCPPITLSSFAPKEDSE